MGKNLQQDGPVISVPNNGSGCVSGVLHMLKYHSWRHLGKKFPNIKSANPKNHVNAYQDEKIPLLHTDSIDCSMDKEKITLSAPVAKGSVTSRIKARISDELSKRKGRHRRCSSSPPTSHLDSTHSIHCFQPAYNNSCPLPPADFNGIGPKTATASSVRFKENSDEYGNQFIENHASIPKNSDGRRRSSVHAKEMLDALDLIDKNKEFVLKYLQDPCSPLAYHFHSQRALSSKRAYSKSLSFSSPSSPRIRASSPRNLNHKGIECDTMEPPCAEYLRSSSVPTVSPEYRRRNQIVMKRFKDLKHKLRHIIIQDAIEKHRIAMDGVLHRIPHGHEIPKDLKTDTDDDTKNHSSRHVKYSSKCSNESDNSLPSNRKSELRCFSRNYSLNLSLDRYSRLFESCSHRQSKQTSKLITEVFISPQKKTPKKIRRIVSSPNLKYCHTEDSSTAFSSGEDMNALGTALSSDQLKTESEVENDIQQNLEGEKHTVDEEQQEVTTDCNIKPEANLDLVCDDLRNLETGDDAYHEKQDTVPPSENFTKTEETNITFVLDSKFSEHSISPASLSVPEDVAETDSKWRVGLRLPDNIDSLETQAAESIKDTPTVAESKVVNVETPSKHLKFQLEDKDKAEFDYVREILELSGFSRHEPLGTWHSDNQPLDPSMLEEMDGCMLSGSQCLGDEESYNVLFFDLINQVLMEIYAKSYSYCPSPLSSLSHIHPMPVGHHVLEEAWANISWYLSSTPVADQLLDQTVSRDLSKNDGWMNLQFDSECLAIEVEDFIFDDLLDDMIFDDLLEGVVWS